MTTLAFKRLGPGELLPRYVFSEKLFVRRRVLEIGAVASTEGTSAAFLLERGARSVVACDANEKAVDEAQKKLGSTHLKFRLDVFESFEPESFDFIAIADVAEWVTNLEGFKHIRSLLTKEGYLLGGLRNPAGIALAQLIQSDASEQYVTCGQLLEAWGPMFSSIEVAQQQPGLGYQLNVASLEGLSIDSQLARDTDAAYWVVIAGRDPATTLQPRWVQLPPEPLALTKNRLAEMSTRARDWQERSEKMKKALEASRALGLEKETELKKRAVEIEKAQESISQLMARLEVALHRPQQESDRDEFARRIRRYEAEKDLAAEQLGASHARIRELEQKISVIESEKQSHQASALASVEEARLERARREQLVRQLDESRERLVAAYNDVKRAQDEASKAAVELEMSKLGLERQRAAWVDLDRERQLAKENEFRLASRNAEILSDFKRLQAQVDTQSATIQENQAALLAKEAEISRLLRATETESQRLVLLRTELEAERHSTSELRQTLDAQKASTASLETEMSSAVSRVAKLEEERKALLANEERLTALSLELEERVAHMHTELQEKQFMQDLLRAHEAQFEVSRKEFEARQIALRKELEETQLALRTLQEKSVTRPAEPPVASSSSSSIDLGEDLPPDDFSMDETLPAGHESVSDGPSDKEA